METTNTGIKLELGDNGFNNLIDMIIRDSNSASELTEKFLNIFGEKIEFIETNEIKITFNK